MELIKNIKEKIKNKYILQIFLLISIALLIFSILSLTNVNIFNKMSFYIFGIWCLLFIILCIEFVIGICNIRLDKNKKIIISIFLIICFIIYIVTMINTKQIYTWDQKCYYNKQIDLLDNFEGNFWSEIKQIVSSTYRNDYGEFLLVFTSLIFNFTNKTENIFILVFCFTEILPVIFTALLIVQQLIRKFNFKHENKILILSGILLVTFPLLHKAAFTGQPDIFGLFWVNLIILLTINYNLQKREILRWTAIIIFSFFLAITRRWYIFWMIGYYLSYAIFTVINAILSKDKEKIINVIKNGISLLLYACIVLVILLFPIIKKTILADYGTSYNAWNLGGLKGEIFNNQYPFLGIIAIFLMIISVIYSFINKKTLSFTFQIILTYIITIVTFTKIQNMGYHQSLILVPEYLLLMILGISALCQIKNTIINNIMVCIIGTYLIIAFYGSYTENKNIYGNNLYSNISLKPVQREDYDKIGEIVEFIYDNCDIAKDKIYINSASSEYCADTFSFYIMPDKSLKNIIYYESSIDSVHGFPIGVLKSKYIFLTNKLIEETGAKKGHIISNIKYGIKDDEVISPKFKMVKEFDLENGIIFYAYERIQDVDELEINEWKELFKKQTELYPKIFGNRLDIYLNNIINN